MLLDQETPYVKASKKVTPPKSDHKHEYVRPFAMMRIKRFDGSVSDRVYKHTIKESCVVCGYQPRRRKKGVIEVEVTPREYRELHAQ